VNYSGCRNDEFECSPGYCINHVDICNGRLDCPNGNDEQNCPPHRRKIDTNEIFIDNFRIVY
jgi:hypothetical protein